MRFTLKSVKIRFLQEAKNTLMNCKNLKTSKLQKMNRKFTQTQNGYLTNTFTHINVNKLIAIFACLFTCYTQPGLAQLSAGAPAFFGIDGDVQNDYRQNGNFAAGGTHDWFKLNSGTGMGVIDTNNTKAYKLSLAAGNNIAFDKGLSVARYSVVNNYLLLDARYSRDYFGAGTGASSDLTTFKIGAKNGSDPASWATNPNGASVPNKSDIIDTYIHFRRNGTVITGTDPSHLIATVGISTTSAIGNRYFDAELFCSSINYNSNTGVFSNSGPASTGGHTPWIFRNDGSVKSFGDMSLAFDFTSTSVNQIYIMVWVSQNDYLNASPKYFDFVSGEYYGSAIGYGYAKIKAKSGSTTVYGSANKALTVATPWGTTAQTLGSISNSYYSLNYDIAQFGEASIDLTSLGIDPVLMNGNNPCAPPYSMVLFKSRSSSAFNSALQDFSGPTEFLNAPVPSSAIGTPANLTCFNTSVTLRAFSIEDGSYYNWASADGSAITNAQSSFITVSKPGTYYLTSSAFKGCSETWDSVTVLQDLYKPKATAQVSNILTPVVINATLMGGDTTASKYNDVNGTYQGLTWSWSGPAAFSSNLQNANTGIPGVYTLVVTQISNGCMDTAMTNVLDKQAIVLASEEISFTAAKKDDKNVKIAWAVNQKAIHNLELERSIDGKEFISITSIATDESALISQGIYVDNISGLNTNQVLYRLKWINTSGNIKFSEIRAVKINHIVASTLIIFPNPAITFTTLTFDAVIEQSSLVQIIDVTGKVVAQKSIKVQRGLNKITLNGLSALFNGLYTIKVSDGPNMLTARLLKVN